VTCCIGQTTKNATFQFLIRWGQAGLRLCSSQAPLDIKGGTICGDRLGLVAREKRLLLCNIYFILCSGETTSIKALSTFYALAIESEATTISTRYVKLIASTRRNTMSKIKMIKSKNGYLIYVISEVKVNGTIREQIQILGGNTK
jgi:hypothetical protein